MMSQEAHVKRQDKERGILTVLVLVISIGLAAALVAILVLAGRVSGAVHEARAAQARADQLQVQVHSLQKALVTANRELVKLGAKPVKVDPANDSRANQSNSITTVVIHPAQASPTPAARHRPSTSPTPRPTASPKPSGGIACQLTGGQVCTNPSTIH